MYEQNRKNNQEYAGQLAVVKRRTKNICVQESYSPLKDEHDKPFLQVLSPFSVNRLNILDTSKEVENYQGQMRNISLYANIPHQDIADFVKRADNALLMLMLYEQGLFHPAKPIPEASGTVKPSTHAFDILKVGTWGTNKENPGDLLLNTKDISTTLRQMAHQREFLRPGEEKYKNNKGDITAIDDALRLLDEEIARDIIANGEHYNTSRVSAFASTYKPENTMLYKMRPSQAVMDAKSISAGGIRIYPTAKKEGNFNDPTKPFSQKFILDNNNKIVKYDENVQGSNKTIYRMWYKIVITCDVTRDQPFHFMIENFYAPEQGSGDLKNPDKNNMKKVSEDKKGWDTEEFDMTENEFIMFVDNIKFNHDTVKMVWYNNARKEDMARRFKPDPSKAKK